MEKGKLIVLGRRAELFCSAQKNYKKNTCGIRAKIILQKKMGRKFAPISGSKHHASIYSVTVTFG
jgi:hypothetical protein